MPKLQILIYPDARLHTVAKPVVRVDARILQLVDDMLETMYAAEGIGLAATQVNVHEQVVVMDTSSAHDQPCVLINPKLVSHSEETALTEEGCLSVPAIYDRVTRFTGVTVQALDLTGTQRELEMSGLDAICVQHEMDHLKGKVFVEYLSLLKRSRIKTKILKRARDARI